jgi:hypothetical protein
MRWEGKISRRESGLQVMRHGHTKLALISILFLFCTMEGAHSETKRLRFQSDEGLCSYEIAFRTEQHPERDVRGTIELLTEPLHYVDTPIVAKPDDIDKIDTSKFDAACANRISTIARLPTVPLNGIEVYRRSIMEEINDTCRFNKIRLIAYRDPSVLRQYEATAACSIFVDALEGKADLFSISNQIALKQCNQNANTQRCLEEHNKDLSDTARIRLYVLDFGWNNCVVPFLKANTMKNSDKRNRLFLQFLAQYRVRRIFCDH